MKIINRILFFVLITITSFSNAQTLEVKEGRSAIIKDSPSGEGQEITRLEAGTKVLKIGDAPRYYAVQYGNNKTGYSYKGNFIEVEDSVSFNQTSTNFQFRSDVLQIIVIDVEVGDATLIICPEENGQQDILLIDTGENDADRVKQELINQGIALSGTPITRFYASH